MSYLVLFLLINITPVEGVTIGINSSGEVWIGYRKSVLLPYLSLSFTDLKGTYTYLFQSHNDILPEPYQEKSDGDTIKVNIGLLTARLGTKLFFPLQPVNPFFNVSAGLPLPLYIQIKDNDESEQAEWDSLKARLYEKSEPTIIVSVGIGLEKFIGERFSISGEINYNYNFGGLWLQSRYLENPTYWEKEERRVNYKIGKTGTAITLNYYF